MSNMFLGCSSLEFIDLSNFNTELVSNISGMFSGCNLIKSLNLSSFNTLNTIDMSEIFYGCNNLEILDISNFDTAKCDSYNNMFSNYANLKYIDIKNLKNDNIFKDSFNNSKLFYVCQSMVLIRNYYAFNCCVYDIENHECDYIPPSTTILETTIINEPSFPNQTTEYSLNNQLNESTNQIVISVINEITQSISNAEIKNETSTRNIDQTILTTQISEGTKQNSNSNMKLVTTTQTIDEKEQTTNIEIVTVSNTQANAKTEYQPTTHIIDYITNKIDATNKLSNTPSVPSEIIYHSTAINYNNNTTENITNEITSNIPTTDIEKIQPNTTKIEKTEIIEKYRSEILYTTQREYIGTIPFNTTINHIETTNIQISKEINLPINDFISFKLLGFSNFEMNPDNFTFNIYLIPSDNNSLPENVSFPVVLDYNRNIRLLKQVESICTLENIIFFKNYQYLCVVYEDTSKIKNIAIIPTFNFPSLNNINLNGISPIAKKFMNNLQTYDNKYDILLNSKIYILDNSTYSSDNILSFNISGVIVGDQPKLENKNINIISNLKNQTTEIEINCTIKNITFNNYLLHCKKNESFNLDLQSAISFIDDGDILLFNFYNTSDFITENVDDNTKKTTYNKRLSFKNQKGGFSAGIIATLIIILIVIIVSTIFTVYYFRRKNVKIENKVENSTIENLKSIYN